MTTLTNKVVLITGAARGIGAGLAKEVVSKGAKVALLGLEASRLESLCRELGSDHFWHECDVTDYHSLEIAVQKTLKHFGKIDVIVANAGISSAGTVEITPIEALMKTLDVNMLGVVRTAKATLEALKASQGYLLLISSASALTPTPGITTYAASKAGVEHFGKSLRQELMRHNVGVGVAFPCWIETDLVKDVMHDLPQFKKSVEKLPWPFNKISTIDECSRLLREAIESRSQTIFVPKSIRIGSWLRPILNSDFLSRINAKSLARTLPKMEKQILENGRFFGKSSMGLSDKKQIEKSQ